MIRLLLVLSFLAAAANSSPFVDNDNIESLAELVCKSSRGTKSLLSRFSTLERLAEYLSGLNEGHKLYQCRGQHLESLEQLIGVVKAGAEDVCGEQKLALVEAYHRRYVAKREQRAPEMVKLFFMQYASEVSQVCEQSAIEAMGEHSFSAEQVAQVEELRKFTDALGMNDLKRGYKRLYLFWKLVDGLNLAEEDKFARYLIKGGAEKVRLNVQMRDARGLGTLQALCRKQLRPIYSRSILPVLRLVVMGYYPRGGQLLDNLARDPGTRSTFFVAQICETVLPIAAFSDDKLADDEFVALTKEEASKLSPVQLDEDAIATRETIKLEPRSLEASQLVLQETDLEAIASNVASRSKVVRFLIKNMVKQLRVKLGAAFKGLRLLRKTPERRLEAVDVESVEEEMDGLQVEEEHEEGLTRRKRGFFRKLAHNLMFAGVMIYLLVLQVTKVAIFLIPGIILGGWAIQGVKWADKLLRKIWYFGLPRD